MPSNDLARALMMLSDPEVRSRLAAGELAALAGHGLDLDEDEQSMVIAAAIGDSHDDVVGFESFAPPFMPTIRNEPLLKAIRTVDAGLTDGPLRDQFRDWTGTVGRDGDW